MSSQIAIYEGPYDDAREMCETRRLRVVSRGNPAIYVMNIAKRPKRLHIQGLAPWLPGLTEDGLKEYARNLCVHHANTVNVPEGPGIEDRAESLAEPIHAPGMLMFND